MAEKEKLEVQVTTQGAERAARDLDKVAKKADELDGKKIDIKGLDVGSDADLLSKKLSDLAGPGGIIAGLGAGMAFVANSTADAAIEADNLAALTGDSVEQASRLNAVWKSTGADSKDLQDVLLQMNGVLATNSGLAEELGVNLNDGATVGQRFEQVSKALDGITDSAKRSQIASQVFGEEGVRQYTALRQAVGDVGAAMENVPDGQVFDEEDVEQAREMKQEIAELKAEVIGFANSVGKFAIPAVNSLIDGVRAWYDGISDAGAALGDFIRTGDLDNTHLVESFEEAERAAADFDHTLIDGLGTYADVRAKVLEVTGSQHAANVVANEWAETHQTAATVARDYAASLAELEPQHRRSIEAMQGDADAADAAAEANERKAEADEKAAEAADRHREVVEALADAEERRLDIVNRSLGGAIRLSQSQRDARDSLWRYNETVKEHNEAAPEFKLNQDQMRDLIEETALDQLDAADAAAQYRIQQAEASGATVSAKDAQRILIEELNNVANTLTGPVRDAVLQAIADLDNLARDRFFTVNGQIIMNQPGRVGDFGGAPLRGGLIVGASGGIVNRPTMALIGEAGPEAVVPLSQSPGNSPLPAGIGAAAATVSIGPVYITANDTESVYDKLAREARMKGPGPILRALGIE